LITAIIFLLIIVGIISAGWWATISSSAESGSVIRIIFTIASNLIGSVSIFSAAYLWLNSHNLKFYLMVQRIKHHIFPSKSITWDVQARWEILGDETALDVFEEWLKKKFINNIHINKQTERIRNYLIENRYNIETSYEWIEKDVNNDIGIIVLRIYTLTVNFAEAKEVLEKDVMMTIENMVKNLRIKNSEAYNLKMTFDNNKNPFLGLYVQRLHPKEIKRLNLIIDMSQYDDDKRTTLEVSTGELSITSHSRLIFQTTVLDFLSFAPRLIKVS
jgi:hypothetical protein